MLLNPFTFYAPVTISEAIELYSKLEGARLQAGGTFLLNALKLQKRKGAKTPQHIISLRKIQELKGIEQDKTNLIIKAMTTIDELYDSKQLTGNLKILKTACRNVSTQPIRNMATVGGNLTCRYTWTEMPAVAIGMEARMHFQDEKGQKEALDAEDFYKAQAKTTKIFTHLSIPKDPDATFVYRRVKKTPYVDIPLLSLMIKTTVTNRRLTKVRVAVNNCVNFAQRDLILEGFLNDKALDKRIIEEALDHMDNSIYDTRSSEYKKYMFRVSVKNALKEIVENHA